MGIGSLFSETEVENISAARESRRSLGTDGGGVNSRRRGQDQGVSRTIHFPSRLCEGHALHSNRAAIFSLHATLRFKVKATGIGLPRWFFGTNVATKPQTNNYLKQTYIYTQYVHLHIPTLLNHLKSMYRVSTSTVHAH